MGAVIILLHPFFVDISAGGLNKRTHLSVRPYITHRGKRTVAGIGAVILIHPHVLVCIPLNRRKWLRCRDVPIQVRPTLIQCAGVSNTYRSLLNDGYILLHPFFVDISVGRLNQRTHLPVRPYIMHRGNILHRENIMHRGKHPPDGNRPSRSQNAEKQRKSRPE